MGRELIRNPAAVKKGNYSQMRQVLVFFRATKENR